MDLDTILVIIGIVVLLVCAAAFLFGAFMVRRLTKELNTTVASKLDDLKKTTEGLIPACENLDPLMTNANVTLDALDMSLTKADEVLAKISGIGDMAMALGAGASKALRGISSKAKSHGVGDE